MRYDCLPGHHISFVEGDSAKDASEKPEQKFSSFLLYRHYGTIANGAPQWRGEAPERQVTENIFL